MNALVHDLIFDTARQRPDAPALAYRTQRLDYAMLAAQVQATAAALLACNVGAGQRVAVYLDKQIETVLAMFGASAAGAVFVPVNPLLKPAQVAHILRDCGVSLLVTSSQRLATLQEVLPSCAALSTIVVTDQAGAPSVLSWPAFIANGQPGAVAHARHAHDVAAIFYTSGSTGQPKGVVLSHRNLCAGARSVASYLANQGEDRLLAVLPLSFDYGFSQLSTAFCSGASVVLMNYLFARDIVTLVEQESITGLAAVPALWNQLARQAWPADCTLRYLTNSGGSMPRAVLDQLRQVLPSAQVFLMYGLTEAFRSTYLPPAQLDLRPGSIGRAIPDAEVLVLRPDGSRCAAGEAGELVHRGALVAQGYWNDPVRSAERFRPLPGSAEIAVWSGDTVMADEAGYLYFVGRRDDMIKSAGYRISAQEVEEVVYASGLVDEAVALGAPHPERGQVVVLIVAGMAAGKEPQLLQICRAQLPSYMAPTQVRVWPGSLPRNPNGKLDRQVLAGAVARLFAGSTAGPPETTAAATKTATATGSTTEPT